MACGEIFDDRLITVIGLSSFEEWFTTWDFEVRDNQVLMTRAPIAALSKMYYDRFRRFRIYSCSYCYCQTYAFSKGTNCLYSSHRVEKRITRGRGGNYPPYGLSHLSKLANGLGDLAYNVEPVFYERALFTSLINKEVTLHTTFIYRSGDRKSNYRYYVNDIDFDITRIGSLESCDQMLLTHWCLNMYVTFRTLFCDRYLLIHSTHPCFSHMDIRVSDYPMVLRKHSVSIGMAGSKIVVVDIGQRLASDLFLLFDAILTQGDFGQYVAFSKRASLAFLPKILNVTTCWGFPCLSKILEAIVVVDYALEGVPKYVSIGHGVYLDKDDDVPIL